MHLYHAGYETIKSPDIHHGRRNADFGQGFYLTEDEEFARRWAGGRKDAKVIVNKYDLDTEGLIVKTFDRDESWFDYIFANRNLKPDNLTADVIIGPIANDTIFNTLGITTSGLLSPEDSMKLLTIGPKYRQITLKTEKAASKLQWTGSYELTDEETAGYKAKLAAEERRYQAELAKVANNL